ncbi:unnamed protein product, partial [Mesorhabditis belari]|uniref:Uncharacterized protein n=1 Tax=Mesorhabditis belari TaxID=2138241 RepID=A0AAF3FJ85_9BILA
MDLSLLRSSTKTFSINVSLKDAIRSPQIICTRTPYDNRQYRCKNASRRHGIIALHVDLSMFIEGQQQREHCKAVKREFLEALSNCHKVRGDQRSIADIASFHQSDLLQWHVDD